MNAKLLAESNQLTMDSTEIARLTGKQHSHILRDIDHMLESLSLSQSNFGYAVQSQTWTMRRYRLPKDLTITLVSWYNVKLRKAIIDRWLELEWSQTPMTFEEMAKHTIMLADQRIKALETKIEEDKPLVEFANTVSNSSDAILVREYAKILHDEEWINIWQNKLYKWFRDNGFLNKQNEPYQHFMKYFKVTESTSSTIFWTRINKTTKITWKWQLYFLSKLKEEFKKQEKLGIV